MNEWIWWHKALEALFSLIGGLGIVGLGWLVGLGLTAKWNIRQKRREFELTTLGDFYKLYGELFTVLKLWHAYKDGMEAPDNTRWNLLERAARVDGSIEAMLIKVTSERQLPDETISNLGKMRQGFQRLRESIRDGDRLDWGYSEHEEYAELKRLSSFFSTMLVSEKNNDFEGPEPIEAAKAFIYMTANERENEWDAIIDREKAKRLTPGK